jgi:hypothetical protein
VYISSKTPLWRPEVIIIDIFTLFIAVESLYTLPKAFVVWCFVSIKSGLDVFYPTSMANAYFTHILFLFVGGCHTVCHGGHRGIGIGVLAVAIEPAHAIYHIAQQRHPCCADDDDQDGNVGGERHVECRCAVFCKLLWNDGARVACRRSMLILIIGYRAAKAGALAGYGKRVELEEQQRKINDNVLPNAICALHHEEIAQQSRSALLAA